MNFTIQILSFIKALIDLLRICKAINYSDSIDEQVLLMLEIMRAIIDILTCLSILYLHHGMGLRSMKQNEKVDIFHDSLSLPIVGEERDTAKDNKITRPI